MLTPTMRSVYFRILFLVAFTVGAAAQSGSPHQSEYLSPPVAAGPRVDEFSGDFSYGIPVLTVPDAYGDGYTVMLSYRAGASPDAVSWVGYGWSINPGAIVRSKRGFPDDWSGKEVFLNKTPTNYTISASQEIGVEVASLDGVSGGSFQGSATKQYSNLTGFARIWGLTIGASFLGNFAGLSYLNENGDEDPRPILSPNLFTTIAHYTDINPKPNASADKITPGGIRYRSVSRALSHGSSRIHLGPVELMMGPPVTHPIHGGSVNVGMKTGITLSAGVFVGVESGQTGNVIAVWNNDADTMPAHGYLNSHRALEDPGSVMDMAYERDLPYSFGDLLLPMPVSNADHFSVVGGGSFRAYNRGLASYRPNAMTSELDVDNLEFKIIGGAGFGIGTRWGDGSITYESGEWRDPADSSEPAHRFSSTGEHGYLFRMNGDLGGELWYDNTVNARRATISLDASTLAELVLHEVLGTDLTYFPRNDASIKLTTPEWKRPERSVHVGYTLNKEMMLSTNDVAFKSYNRDLDSRRLVSDRSLMPDGIGEFALYGSEGSRFVYGLPVYARDERTVQLGLPNYRRDSANRVLNNSIAYRHTDMQMAPTAVGHEHPDPYATAWLLTSKTGADYVDRTGDGPSDDDYGGWVRFRYARHAGSDAKTLQNPGVWEYWRSPRSGLHFSPGNLSDPEDDLGGYSHGRKELYYLDRIETRTHVALFVLSDSIRKDGYGVDSQVDIQLLAGDSTSAMPSWDGNNFHSMLNRIELFTKSAEGSPDSLLTTVASIMTTPFARTCRARSRRHWGTRRGTVY